MRAAVQGNHRIQEERALAASEERVGVHEVLPQGGALHVERGLRVVVVPAAPGMADPGTEGAMHVRSLIALHGSTVGE